MIGAVRNGHAARADGLRSQPAWISWATEPGGDIGAEFDEVFRLVSAAGSVVLER